MSLPTTTRSSTVSGEYLASRVSYLTFSWITRLIRHAHKQPLEDFDVWAVNPERQVDVLTHNFTANFERNIEHGLYHPLLRALFFTFRAEFLVGGICQFISITIQVISPFALRYVIEAASQTYHAHLGSGVGRAIGKGVVLVFMITFLQVIQSLATNHMLYRGTMIGAQTRAILMMKLFEKTLNIDLHKDMIKAPPPLKDDHGGQQIAPDYLRTVKDKTTSGGRPEIWSSGRILNLMSTDSQRIDQAITMIHMVWALPLCIIATFILIFINIKVAALAGFGLLIILTPVLTLAMKSLVALRSKINSRTDARVSRLHETLHSIRFVKLSDLAKFFQQRILELRAAETSSLESLIITRNAILACSTSSPIFASMISFTVWTLTGHSLAPGPIFSSFALFNSLRLPLNLLPMVVGMAGEATASLSRVETFLLIREIPDVVENLSKDDHAIDVQNAVFSWGPIRVRHQNRSIGDRIGTSGRPPDLEAPSLVTEKHSELGPEARNSGASNIESGSGELRIRSLCFKKTELIAVVGSVGSGKSRLISALAGDLGQTQGSSLIRGKRLLCPQLPWILNASIRENVLFGQDMEVSWYEQVIEACALRHDIEALPAKDLTEVGERGLTLSGGQKQRLSLARAIYARPDVILLDDPLSAVDSRTSKKLFENAICGLLNDSCCMLVTHQLWLLDKCHKIVLLEDCIVTAVDSFDQLIQTNRVFQSLMAQCTKVGGVQEEVESSYRNDQLQSLMKANNSDTKNGTFIEQEDRAAKSVALQTYVGYLHLSGHMWLALVVFSLLLVSQGLVVFSGLWLAYWTEDRFHLQSVQYIGVYASLGLVQAVTIFAVGAGICLLATSSSKAAFKNALGSVLAAPMLFFETTPLGRVTNRLTSDIDILDNILPETLRLFLTTLASLVSLLILVISVLHYFAIAVCVVCIAFFVLANYYRASTRDLKRHEAIRRSLIFVHFHEILTGSETIRAFRRQKDFIQILASSIDLMDGALFLSLATQRWLSIRLDVVGNTLIFITGILVTTGAFNISPSISGLLLAYILPITQSLQILVRQMAEAESCMVAVERVQEYGRDLPSEIDSVVDLHDARWPQYGSISFENVEMRYRQSVPPIIKNISFHVDGGESIGIVGRTGAGKSSLVALLCRLVIPECGRIRIDSVDISTISLHTLRSRLSVIPQDPALFVGTVRSNLDPFGKHEDDYLNNALQQVLLNETNSNEQITRPKNTRMAASALAGSNHSISTLSLDAPVQQDGHNFSVGQRQLLSIARALVQGNQILVCDEATSSVDEATDSLVLQALSRSLRGKTVLFIAHRLRSVLQMDRIMVLEDGRIVEFAKPSSLWQMKGVFRSMCEAAGILETDLNNN